MKLSYATINALNNVYSAMQKDENETDPDLAYKDGERFILSFSEQEYLDFCRDLAKMGVI